jgi:hypothetical protein
MAPGRVNLIGDHADHAMAGATLQLRGSARGRLGPLHYRETRRLGASPPRPAKEEHLRNRIPVTAVVIAAAAAVLALPAFSAQSQVPKLTGTVGPGFTITMKKPTKAGKYTLVVADKSSIHNFRLKGPGVNVATSVPATGTKTFKVTLKKGKYTFLCDPHPTSMIGTFTIRP